MGLDRYQIKNMENNWIYFGIFKEGAEKKTLIERAKEMGLIPQGWMLFVLGCRYFPTPLFILNRYQEKLTLNINN